MQVHFGETPEKSMKQPCRTFAWGSLVMGLILQGGEFSLSKLVLLVKVSGDCSFWNFLGVLPENSATIAFCSKLHRGGDVMSQLMS
jgi:hypothetical protein